MDSLPYDSESIINSNRIYLRLLDIAPSVSSPYRTSYLSPSKTGRGYQGNIWLNHGRQVDNINNCHSSGIKPILYRYVAGSATAEKGHADLIGSTLKFHFRPNFRPNFRLNPAYRCNRYEDSCLHEIVFCPKCISTILELFTEQKDIGATIN